MENKKHGGYRKNSGRKKKPETKVINFRVPKECSDAAKIHIKAVLDEFLNDRKHYDEKKNNYIN